MFLRLLIFMCIIFYTHVASGLTEFSWVNVSKKRKERIVFSSKDWEYQSRNGSWVIFTKLKFDEKDLLDIPKECSPEFFYINSGIIISIPGSGIVFTIDIKNNQLVRSDNTFFRGYNFKALQFFHNDTLYSLGGQGFWHSNNILTYFSRSSKEWEYVNVNGQNSPNRLVKEKLGFNTLTGAVYALESPLDLKPDNSSHFPLYKLMMDSKRWNKLGDVDINEVQKIGLKELNFIWTSRFWYLTNSETLIIDPEKNEIRVYNGNNRLFFGLESQVFCNGEWIYSLRTNKTKNQGTITLDSMTYSSLIKSSVKRGVLYQDNSGVDRYCKFILGVISALIIGFIWKLTMKRKAVSFREKSNFPEGFERLAKTYLQYGKEHLVDANELNIIIECENKAFDTQRQYRSKFIICVNEFFRKEFAIDNAINRVSVDDDRRFVKYGISTEAYDLLSKNDIFKS